LKRYFIIATALVAIAAPAQALQVGVDVQGITLEQERIERARAAARWQRHIERVQARLAARTVARLEARAEAAAAEAAEVEEVADPTPPSSVPSGSISDIICSVFGSTCGMAVKVAGCESGLDPNARNPSGASGLFQLMPVHWEGKFDPFDPAANARYAYGLSNGGTDWYSHWSWSSDCWG
jgi:hypothetical protein